MSANDIQVAGTHYRTEYQHWDLVLDLGLGYFEGQVTKYATRHTKKNGLQDLEKAHHFLGKFMESVHAGTYDHRKPFVDKERMQRIHRYCNANECGLFETEVITLLCNWQDLRHLRDARNLLIRLIAQYAPTGDACAGYVNQDR